ncbi:hypothetical protein C4559_04685 [Candidatus Microgenomates bacterium]|nr:MAG: hypothetical protein C4559_04685 [Candidatus Microgenomates bacterium]
MVTATEADKRTNIGPKFRIQRRIKDIYEKPGIAKDPHVAPAVKTAAIDERSTAVLNYEQSREKAGMHLDACLNTAKRIIGERRYMELGKKTYHQGFYLTAEEVIANLEKLKPNTESPARERAEEIVKNGWLDIYAIDSKSMEKRREALSLLGNLTREKEKELGKAFIKRGEPIPEYRHKLSSLIGIRLAVMSELNPAGFADFEKTAGTMSANLNDIKEKNRNNRTSSKAKKIYGKE